MPLDVPRMLACCAAFGDVDGAQERNLSLCVLILLYMFPHTTIYVSSYCAECGQTCLLSAECGQTCLLILPYLSPHTTMCPHTTTHVSSYYYISNILILLYICVLKVQSAHTHTHTHMQREREREI
jgi:hypothetical protein